MSITVIGSHFIVCQVKSDTLRKYQVSPNMVILVNFIYNIGLCLCHVIVVVLLVTCISIIVHTV